MSRLFYGSSNVYRFFPRVRSTLGLELELVQCTKKTVFDSHVASLGNLEAGSLIITSVLANFIVAGCQGLEANEVVLFANQQITAHVETLAGLLRDCPDASVFIVPPLLRVVPGMFRVMKLKRKEDRV